MPWQIGQALAQGVEPRRPLAAARAIAAACGAVLIAACAVFSPPLWQLPPSALGEHLAQQRLIITRNGETHALDAVVQSESGRLRIIGNALAVRLFTLDYDGTQVSEGPGVGLPAGLPPALIVNDLLAVHAPLPALRAALPEGWWADDTSGVRTVRDARGAAALTITYQGDDPWQGRSELVAARGYRIVIESTEE
ncbi:DUF3261 domain-containing protein [Chitiniphilus eburneus]|nr:DUF3261 domain-containing protein [Chitiniphilus eburneus]